MIRSLLSHLFPVVWSRREKTIEASIAFTLFAIMLIALMIAWGFIIVDVRASTVRSNLDTIIEFEGTVLAVVVAGLGITITLAANQTSRLDALKPALIQHLRNRNWAPILEGKAQQVAEYLADPARDPTRIASFRSPRVKDVSEDDVRRSYTDLAEVAKASAYGSDIESNTAHLFKAAATALLCRTWLDSEDPITALAQAVHTLDRDYGVVTMVNRTYDMRTAARRGLPILSFSLAFCIAASFVASIIPLDHEPQRWFVKGMTFPLFPIVYFVGFYSYLIPVQYMSR